MNKKLAIGFTTLAVIGLAACGQGNSNEANSQNQAVSASELNTFNATQPVPQFNKSQIRQTLEDVESDQAEPKPTTSFFMNLGATDPFSSCPSIGFPVSATDELTNPQQVVRIDTGHQNFVDGVVSQNDPTGIYQGDTTGTYVLCLNTAGQAYAQYWEGYVDTVTGSATWNYTTHRMSNVSNPTGNFSIVRGVKTSTPTVPKS